ncbi:tRNA (adenosine(37)-N6)-threonylcarbamoyltransferase complex dimerization subunit type 1 TsaB [Synechococcus sp. ATX 2A4]|uniref:tRNA (adenosine(37)-N6)-threonylcarbamoyltransferase complex dimerization subunit type 1 TsaB n=1 Tax=Synechococcus sp. ATX 2A4 TaxID=2823727 RepID=UPI0020CD52C3|nr:tRNA (adenosine(37)-N6)-threonylcarbamoyltransferase complex dimerization subunit type 1 TsaB [Synechococcus sp. ATX 2A4]
MTGVPAWRLALHSSSEVLGVALQSLLEPEAPPLIRTFPLGRRLSNDLLACVEEVLPASSWPQLARLAVATGPGGFTGTRLTVVLARTLAQQLALPLDGVSSFLLVARRLWQAGEPLTTADPFWLLQELPRRGVVAGAYALDAHAPGGVVERQPPRLFAAAAAVPPGPQLPAVVEAGADVAQLLAFSQAAAAAGGPAPWATVLPLYPTSPVGAEG